MIFITFLAVLYSLFILWIFIGIFRIRISKNSDYLPFVSVIIAARDEEHNIERCINSLIEQDYSNELFEVFIVNDRSVDKTAEIIAEKTASLNNFHTITIADLPPNISPKKYALQKGIEASRGEIILTTDADCVPKPGWISGMLKAYSDNRIGMVVGYSPLTLPPHGIKAGLSKLDSLSIAAISAGSIGAGYPITCNGRNFSYRKSVFDSIGGFDGLWQHMSGDDDLLLHKANYQNIEVSYSLLPSTYVESISYEGLNEISNQRRRHASKGLNYYTLPGMTALKIALPLIYIFNLLIALGFLGIGMNLSLFSSLILLKSVSEFSLLLLFASKVNSVDVLRYFPLAIILHPFYVVVFGAWGIFGKFTWKGQTNLSQKGIST